MRLRLLIIFCLVFSFTCRTLYAAEKIEELFLRGNYPAVIKEGSRILSKEPNSFHLDKVYFYLGLSNMKLGNFTEARNDFNILLRNFTNSKFNDRASLGIADAYFLEENYLEANKAYEKLSLDRNCDILSLVYFKLAQTNLKLGNWQEAKKYLEKLKNDFPLSFEASLAKNIIVGDEFFTVQVGSFIDSEKAKRLCNELKLNGFDGYVQETLSQGKTFYRVRVGRLTSLKEVKELEQKLSTQSYPTKIFP